MDNRKLATAQLALHQLKEVILGIKEGNIKGSWGRKIVELGFSHAGTNGKHLDDYFIDTFSALGYFLTRFESSHQAELAAAERMLEELRDYAGQLSRLLMEQRLRYKEYVPKSQEFTVKMDEVWELKFSHLHVFVLQFVHLKFKGKFKVFFLDRETPITAETVKSKLKMIGL